MTNTSPMEMERRIQECYRMIMLGVGYHDIIAHIMEEYGIAERGAREVHSRANKIFKEQCKTIRDEEFGKAMERLNLLFNRAMRIQDFKTALAVQKEISAMLNLITPNIEGNSKNQPLSIQVVYGDGNRNVEAAADGEAARVVSAATGDREQSGEA